MSSCTSRFLSFPIKQRNNQHPSRGSFPKSMVHIDRGRLRAPGVGVTGVAAVRVIVGVSALRTTVSVLTVGLLVRPRVLLLLLLLVLRRSLLVGLRHHVSPSTDWLRAVRSPAVVLTAVRRRRHASRHIRNWRRRRVVTSAWSSSILVTLDTRVRTLSVRLLGGRDWSRALAVALRGTLLVAVVVVALDRRLLQVRSADFTKALRDRTGVLVLVG